MSFSMEASPSELRSAIRYAESRGVLMVAAVGNQGDRLKIYPAAYSEVLGAAAQSTASSGSLASFSELGHRGGRHRGARLGGASPPSPAASTPPAGAPRSARRWSPAPPRCFDRPYCSAPEPRDPRRAAGQRGAAFGALFGKVLSGQLDVYRAWQVTPGTRGSKNEVFHFNRPPAASIIERGFRSGPVNGRTPR